MNCSVHLTTIPLNITEQYAKLVSKFSTSLIWIFNAIHQGFSRKYFQPFLQYYWWTRLLRTGNNKKYFEIRGDSLWDKPQLDRALVLGHRHCEVGWTVPFLAAFNSPVFPPGTHLLLGGHRASFQPVVPGGSRTAFFGTVGKRSNRYATHPSICVAI